MASSVKLVVASALIVNEAGRILLGRRAGSGKYCPPGGKVESGESVEEGLAREVLEEVNLTASPDDMEFLGFCDLMEKVVFFYLVPSWEGRFKNREPGKHRDWRWFQEPPPSEECVEGLAYFNRELLRGIRGRTREKI